MVTKIFLIRHGETEDAEERRYKGHIDIPLSGRGMKQIKSLSDYMVRHGSTLFASAHMSTDKTPDRLQAVYTSDLSRAFKSAQIIADPFDLQPLVVDGLKERSFGAWEGMSFDEIQDKYPDAFAAWAENPLKFSPLEGESTIDVRERAMKAFHDIIQKHEGANVAIVAHGGINRIILCELLDIPLENIFRVEQDFGALNIIELWDYPVVKLLNFRLHDSV